MSSPKPISIHIPGTLSKYAKPASEYISGDLTVDAVAVGGLVFAYPAVTDSKPSVPHILLVKRAADDGGMASLWETPGGGCEDSDPTLIHSTAREVFEEAGLRLTAAIAMVGEYRFPTRSGKRIVKLSFEIQVQEIKGPQALEDIPVEITPEEHSDFRWVTEPEIATGDVFPFTSQEQRQVIIQGFKMHKERMNPMASASIESKAMQKEFETS